MDERVELFLRKTGPVLCADIGGLTQKILLARPGWKCESWPRFLLPTRARLVTQRIRELTLLKRGIWLYGSDMGGGFGDALRAHMASGLPVYSTSAAAASIHDNMQLVQQMGIKITEVCPPGCAPIHLCDFDPQYWYAFFRMAELPQPHITIAAVQDHGNHDNGNREARMKYWQKRLLDDPDPIHWIYEKAPDEMGRLRALQQFTGGPVADTVTAAILGGLCDDRFFHQSCRQGVTFINAGNVHTMAALVYQEKVYGIYMHHTEKRELEVLLTDIDAFRKRAISGDSVQASGGHGAVFGKSANDAGDWTPTFISGPARSALANFGEFLAPHGDMPHAGCFGLLYGWARGHAKV